MGLDQYLYRKIYIKRWEWLPPSDQHHLTLTMVNPTYVTDEVGYWRKANAIHRWFVDNCGGGRDDCQEIEVSREQLATLAESVRTVLGASKLVDGVVTNGYSIEAGGEWKPILEPGKTLVDATVASEILPTMDGFFFGSTDYDQWYIEDLELTAEICQRALETEADYFIYQASW